MEKKKAFTLIELVVVMAIIAVLTLLVVGAIIVARNTSTETTNRSNANAVRAGLESYYTRYRVYCAAPAPAPVSVTCTAGTLEDKRAQLALAGITVNLAGTRTTAPAGGGFVSTLGAQTGNIQVADWDGGATPLTGVNLIDEISLP